MVEPSGRRVKGAAEIPKGALREPAARVSVPARERFSPAAHTLCEPSCDFAAAREGLLRSTDHGDTWAPWAFAGQPVAAVAIDPHTPSTLFAITDRSPGNDLLTVWKSTDDGRTWAQLGISAERPATDFTLPRFVFDPEHSGTL